MGYKCNKLIMQINSHQQMEVLFEVILRHHHLLYPLHSAVHDLYLIYM